MATTICAWAFASDRAFATKIADILAVLSWCSSAFAIGSCVFAAPVRALDSSSEPTNEVRFAPNVIGHTRVSVARLLQCALPRSRRFSSLSFGWTVNAAIMEMESDEWADGSCVESLDGRDRARASFCFCGSPNGENKSTPINDLVFASRF